MFVVWKRTWRNAREASGNEALEGETEKLLKKEEILKIKKEELQTNGQEQEKL